MVYKELESGTAYRHSRILSRVPSRQCVMGSRYTFVSEFSRWIVRRHEFCRIVIDGGCDCNMAGALPSTAHCWNIRQKWVMFDFAGRIETETLRIHVRACANRLRSFIKAGS
jgi:hypothetical protein